MNTFNKIINKDESSSSIIKKHNKFIASNNIVNIGNIPALIIAINIEEKSIKLLVGQKIETLYYCDKKDYWGTKIIINPLPMIEIDYRLGKTFYDNFYYNSIEYLKSDLFKRSKIINV